MAVTKDSIEIDVSIEGKKAGEELKAFKQEIKALEKEALNLTIGSQEWLDKMAEIEEKKKQMDEFKNKVAEARQAINQMAAATDDLDTSQKAAAGSLNAMRQNLQAVDAEVDRLKADMAGLVKGTKEWNDKMAELKARQKEQREVQDAVDKTSESIDGATKATGLWGRAILLMETYAVPLLVLAAAAKVVSDSIAAFNEDAEASNELTRALDGNVAAAERLKAQADELENTTLIKDEEIKKAQAQLALYADTEEQIAALTPLVLDYAKAMGTDAAGAAETIGVALTAEAGALEDLGVKFDESTSKADRFAIIQQVLNDKVGGAAKTAADSGANGWERLSLKLGNLLEKVGTLAVKIAEGLMPIIEGLVDSIVPLVDVLVAAGTAASDFFQAIVGESDKVVSQADRMAKEFARLPKEQQEAYAKSLSAIGVNMDAVRKRAAELEQEERRQFEQTRLEFAKKYSSMDKEQQAFYLNYARRMGVSEEKINAFVKDSNAIRAEQERLANAALAESRKKEAEAAQKEREAEQKKREDAAKKKADDLKKQTDEERAAQQKITDLKLATIADETQRSRAMAEEKAKREIEQLKGSAQAQADAEKLIRERLALEVQKINTDAANAEAETQKANRQKLEDLQVSAIADETQRGIAGIKLKAEREIAELKLVGEQRAAAEIIIRQQAATQIADIETKAAAADLAKKKDALEKEIAALESAQQTKIQTADAIAAAELQKVEGNEEEKFRIQTEAYFNRLEQERIFLQEKLRLLQESGLAEQATIQAVQNAILKNETDTSGKRIELEKRTAANKEKLSQLGKGIAKEASDFAIALLGKDEESRKKNAEKIKAIQIAQVFMDVWTEIAAIWKWANSNAINGVIPGWGVAVATAQSAFAIGRSAVAASNIASQKFEHGGIIGGQRHSNGGNLIVDSQSGQVIGEMEKGEPYMILSRDTYRNNGTVIDALLESSTKRGGAPIFEDGGIFIDTVPNRVTDYITAPTASSAASNELATELLAEQRETNRLLRSGQRLRAEVVYQDIVDKGTELEQIKGKASF
jgi:hypothetical protein